MRRLLVLALVASGLALPVLADPLPVDFEVHKFNGSQRPATQDGITTFHVAPKECSNVDYGDGRGESDCKNGSVKSIIRYTRDTKVGESFEYKFDLQFDMSTFKYTGEFRRDAVPFSPGGWDSSLRLASWEGPFIKDFVYILKASTTKGVTFMGRECQSPEKLGEWLSFSLKVRWANDSKGWVVATCDGKPIYVEEGVVTTRQTQCYLANECTPGITRKPKSLNFILGLSFNGYGNGWKEYAPSLFRDMQSDGITMLARNVSVTKGVALYGPDETSQVSALQAKLSELGCDTGAADGVLSEKTRNMALTCRDFSPAPMPTELNVATLADFVALYSRPDAKDLPAGKPPVPPLFIIHIAGAQADKNSTPEESIYEFTGLVERPDAKPMPLSYLTIGGFNPDVKAFDWLDILVQQPISKGAAKKLASCGDNRVEDWGKGGFHVVLAFKRTQSNYPLKDADCIIDAVKGSAADETAFLIDHFDDLAKTLTAEGSTAALTDAGLKTFIERLGRGELTIGR